MWFKVIKASGDYSDGEQKEINSLEELIAFMESVDEDIVITRPLNLDEPKEYRIIVYDDYIE